MAITIGLPPSGMFSHIDNWKRHKDTALCLDVCPFNIDADKFEDVAKDILNASNTFELNKQTIATFGARAQALGAQWDDITGRVDESGIIHIYALHEGPITENFNNDISASSLSGLIYEKLGGSELANFTRVLQNSFGSGKRPLEETVKELGSWAFGDSAEANESIKELISGGLGDKESIKKMLSSLEMNSGNIETASTLLSNVITVSLGQRPLFPRLWNDSSSSTNYTFRVRLYNPNPASWEMHRRYIVTPLAVLKTLALPSTLYAEEKTEETEDEDGKKTTTGTGVYESKATDLTYMAPFYVRVVCKNLFRIDMGMIENLSVILGGDENAISFNGRPNCVDVTFTIKPLYNQKVIQPETYQFFANESLNMYELKGYDSSTVTQSETDTDDDGEIVASTNDSDEPTDRVNPEETAAANEVEGNGLTETAPPPPPSSQS